MSPDGKENIPIFEGEHSHRVKELFVRIKNRVPPRDRDGGPTVDREKLHQYCWSDDLSAEDCRLIEDLVSIYRSWRLAIIEVIEKGKPQTN